MAAMLMLQHFAEHEDLTLILDPIALNNFRMAIRLHPSLACLSAKSVILEERKKTYESAELEALDEEARQLYPRTPARKGSSGLGYQYRHPGIRRPQQSSS